jgi:U1 small nuclear ribonucleoprotein C
MPRFFDDYSNTYLTHDSAAGRKQQRRGWKFRENFKLHYETHLEDWRKGPMGLASAQQAYVKARGNVDPMIPPLPPGWKEDADDVTGIAFFFNDETGARTWVRPGFIPPPPGPMGRGGPPPSQQGGGFHNNNNQHRGGPPPPGGFRGPPPGGPGGPPRPYYGGGGGPPPPGNFIPGGPPPRPGNFGPPPPGGGPPPPMNYGGPPPPFAPGQFPHQPPPGGPPGYRQ